MTKRLYNKIENELHILQVQLIASGISNEDMFDALITAFDEDDVTCLTNVADGLLALAEAEELFEFCQQIKELKETIK